MLGSRSSNLQNEPKYFNNLRVTDWDNLDLLNSACKNVNIIVHSAGMNASDCVKNPTEAFKINAVATGNLVKAAIRNKVQKIIYFSTAHVYKERFYGDINEATSISNLHPYATSHVAGESILRWFHKNNEIDVIVLRMSNAYGYPVNNNKSCWNLFVNNLCKQVVETGTMVVHSDPSQQRNFLPVSSVCNVVEHFICSGNRQNIPVYNLGSLTTNTLLEMATIIQSRCEVVLNFKPIIKCSSFNDIVQRKNLEFSIDKLLAQGLTFDSNNFEEIDNLLLHCNNYFRK